VASLQSWRFDRMHLPKATAGYGRDGVGNNLSSNNAAQ
jgi:hypothetical protein